MAWPAAESAPVAPKVMNTYRAASAGMVRPGATPPGKSLRSPWMVLWSTPSALVMLELMGMPIRYAAAKPPMAAPDGLTLRVCVSIKSYRPWGVAWEDMHLHPVIAGGLLHFVYCFGWHFEAWSEIYVSIWKYPTIKR